MADMGAWNGSSPMMVGQPVGNTYRGIGADWFNAGNIAREDWQRSEQSAQYQFFRDMQKLDVQNSFNAAEAEKNRTFNAEEAEKAYARQREARQTAYQDTISDLKAAGLNPILAFDNGSTPMGSSPSASGSPASSGSGSSSPGRNYVGKVAKTSELLGFAASLAQISAGLYAGGQDRAAKLAMASAEHSLKRELSQVDTLTEHFDSKLRLSGVTRSNRKTK